MKTLVSGSLLILTSLYFQINAQVIHVPADSFTIQAAINGASDGDTVLVAPGLYYENINFMGKAITVASHFLVDRDTSHISKTIIDGSQATKADSASVVYFVNDEDTTSVLTGFTITGGKGTTVDMSVGPFPSKGSKIGGGIISYLCGGKITQNIIRDNHLYLPNNGAMRYPDSLGQGAGIVGIVYDYHTLIIRDNVIQENSIDADNMANGGGIAVGGANVIIEGNEIKGNTCSSEMGMAVGGGIAYFGWTVESEHNLAIIRNNRIHGNDLFSNRIAPDNPPVSMGGALFINGSYQPVDLKVYNNLMYNNYTEGEGGGVGIEYIDFELSNNTIVNNEAEVDGNDLYCRYESNTTMYNNIMWSETDNDNSEISIHPGHVDVITINAHYNNIKGGWVGTGNIDTIPGFEEDSYQLTENSPCVGNGVESIEINGTRYYAAGFDLNDSGRPHSIDNFVDLGALESPYKRTTDTGIGNIAALSSGGDISIYPNPFSASMTIDMNNPKPIQKVEILSIDGRIIRIIENISSNLISIDRGNLPSGMYLLQINGDRTLVKKVIVE